MFDALYDLLTDQLVIGFVVFVIMLLILKSYVFKSDDEFTAGLFLRMGIAYISATALTRYIYEMGYEDEEDDATAKLSDTANIDDWFKQL